MTQPGEFEHGPMHGEHSKRFYVVGTVILVVGGMLGGYLLRPDDWHLARALIAGALTGVLSGYCVFAWHMLLGTTEER